MDQREILSRLRAEVPDGVLLDSSWDTLRFAIRSAFEFAEFLSNVRDAANVTPDVERVALRLSEALNEHYDLGPVVGDALVAMAGDLSEEAEYANESIVAGAELFSDLRQIALQLVRDTPPMPLKWRVYPSVLELKAEFLVHLERLRSAEAAVQERLVALMNLSRLQMTFLANTFC